jgi:hypothetical protein
MGSDPSGHFDLVEFAITSGINAIQFGIRIAPVARVAFGLVDAITASEIIYKGINEGFDKVTPLEWATLGISAIGAITAVPGTNLLVKAALSAFLHVPLGPALATFNGARLAIGQLAKLEEITTIERTAAGAERVGQFVVDSAGNPIIRYFKSGNELEDATTLLHELFHYAEWVARGKPTYSALLAATTGPLEEAAEVVAKLVIKLVQA